MDFLEKYASWIVFLSALFICTSFIGGYPIYILDEARNAEAAREMYVNGDYIVPFFNGELRTDKPPLHYYFMALGYELFGISAFGARFFSGVFGALTILVTFLFARKRLGFQAASLSVVILSSSVFFVQEFHLAVPDPYLIFFASFTLFCFYEFYDSSKKKWLLWAYMGIGLGILTKGPVAIALPGLSVFLFLILKRALNFKNVMAFRPILGLLLSLIIAIPWYHMVHAATNGEWTKGFFLDHNVNRFNSGKEGHGGLFLLTPLFVFLGMLPFSIFLTQGFSKVWRERKQNDFQLFAAVVSLVTVTFFSVASTKLPNYPMPCYPFIAIILARLLREVGTNKPPFKSLKYSVIFLIFVSILLPIGGYMALSQEKTLYEVRWVALLLSVLTIVSLFVWLYFKKAAYKKMIVSIALGWGFMGLLLFGVIYPMLTMKSPTVLASKIIGENSDVVVYQRFDSAFPFHFNRTFTVVHTLKELEDYLGEHPQGYILTNTRNTESLLKLQQFNLIMEQKALFENHTTRIYTK